MDKSVKKVKDVLKTESEGETLQLARKNTQPQSAVEKAQKIHIQACYTINLSSANS